MPQDILATLFAIFIINILDWLTPSPNMLVIISAATNRSAFWRGFMVTMTNPKAVIFFGSILTAFVPVNAPFWMLLVIVVFSVLHSVLLHFITASLFSTTRVREWFQYTRRGMQRLFGTIYIALGLGVAMDAYKRL